MNIFSRFFPSRRRAELPEHIRRGRLGEKEARKHLSKCGLKFLTENFSSKRGEIDLIFRDQDCLVFVEVKTRSSEEWSRPSAAVDRAKKEKISRAALDYLRLLDEPRVKIRFDIVEVLLSGESIGEVRHLPNAFNIRGRTIFGDGVPKGPPRRFHP
jgi:putative endonuclease